MSVPKARSVGVILAAGEARRSGYLGGILPKTLIPVAGRPLVWYCLKSLARLGSSEVIVAGRADGGILRRYLDSLDPRSVGLKRVVLHEFVVPTKSPISTLDQAIASNDEPVAVALGDDFTVSPDLETFRNQFVRSSMDVAQAVVVDRDPAAIRRACELSVNTSRQIVSIREKPRVATSRLRGCGLYLFKPGAYRAIRRSMRRDFGRLSMSDIVAVAVESGRAMGYRIRGVNVNMNTIDDVLRAWRSVRGTGRL